jgi:hypothetical protein
MITSHRKIPTSVPVSGFLFSYASLCEFPNSPHVESLEKRVNGDGVYGPALHAPDPGIWHWGDFSI